MIRLSDGGHRPIVMAGPCAGHPRLSLCFTAQSRMAGPSPAMTVSQIAEPSTSILSIPGIITPRNYQTGPKRPQKNGWSFTAGAALIRTPPRRHDEDPPCPLGRSESLRVRYCDCATPLQATCSDHAVCSRLSRTNKKVAAATLETRSGPVRVRNDRKPAARGELTSRCAGSVMLRHSLVGRYRIRDPNRNAKLNRRSRDPTCVLSFWTMTKQSRSSWPRWRVIVAGTRAPSCTRQSSSR